MNAIHRRLPALALIAAALTFTACSDESPLAPEQDLAIQPQFSGGSNTGLNQALAQIRGATARYHDIEVAKKDGFVLLHECETRDGEGVGTVYVNFARVLDGAVNPKLPDALVYEPGKNGKLKLVAAEFAILITPGSQPPEFFGHEFQTEDEFGVYGLHVWVWRHNPNGMFAETNPRVSCDN